MTRVRPSVVAVCLVLASLAIGCPGPARAQFSGFAAANDSGIGSYLGGSSAYVPFSSFGGFVPYSPGGGVGVQPGMRGSFATPMEPARMRPMVSTGSTLGLLRGQLTPLSPISARGMGGMGSAGGLIRRGTSGGSMRGMARPPVGGYPFRQPPSLLGPASARPSMSM